MSEEVEPLPEDVRALVDRAKPIDDLPSAQQAAILAAVGAKVGLSALGVPAAAPAKGFLAAALGATLAVGVGAGVAIDRAFLLSPVAAPAPTGAPSQSPPPPPLEPTPSVPVWALPSVPTAAPSVSRPGLRATASVAAERPTARGLAAERAVLDVARSALAQGDAGRALEAAERHRAEYPAGILAEEREAIAIRALATLGRRDEARARATAFARTYPNSLNARAVESAVEDR